MWRAEDDMCGEGRVICVDGEDNMCGEGRMICVDRGG